MTNGQGQPFWNTLRIIFANENQLGKDKEPMRQLELVYSLLQRVVKCLRLFTHNFLIIAPFTEVNIYSESASDSASFYAFQISIKIFWNQPGTSLVTCYQNWKITGSKYVFLNLKGIAIAIHGKVVVNEQVFKKRKFAIDFAYGFRDVIHVCWTISIHYWNFRR